MYEQLIWKRQTRAVHRQTVVSTCKELQEFLVVGLSLTTQTTAGDLNNGRRLKQRPAALKTSGPRDVPGH
jgi:hypothetical protein